MENQQNPWGQPASARLDWTKGLPFEVPVVRDLAKAGRLDEIEVLYWVGCAAAFDERNKRVARAFATCLHVAGVKFAVLGEEEACTGDPARRMGNEYVFQMLATQNIETFEKYGSRPIVTACPHCFNTLANEYPQFGGRYDVRHHTATLPRCWLRVGSQLGTSERGPKPGRVTLHDSCYLARYNGIVDEPREILRSVGSIELAEMSAHGRQTACCGAGGGRMWMEETRGTRINAARTHQVLATDAQTLATSCPFCMTMLRDGLADAGAADKVSALDVAEILAPSPSLGGPPPKGRDPLTQCCRQSPTTTADQSPGSPSIGLRLTTSERGGRPDYGMHLPVSTPTRSVRDGPDRRRRQIVLCRCRSQGNGRTDYRPPPDFIPQIGRNVEVAKP